MKPLCIYCQLQPVRGTSSKARKCALCQHKRPSRHLDRDISAKSIEVLIRRAEQARRQRAA
jgi:hypothetical protein